MKRWIFGLGLLLALLAVGIWIQNAISSRLEPEIPRLSQAADAAQGEHWAEAEALSSQVQQVWAETWPLAAAIADHTPMEEIDSLFAELQVYARCREAVHFSAVCAQLETRLDAMANAHVFSWWNLL